MPIEIVENHKPKLPLCKMICDTKIADHLDNFELTKFLNSHSVNLILGRPGSGKTSLLYTFFKSKGKNRILRKVFDNIYLFMPSNSRNSIQDNIFDELSDEKKFDSLSAENLQTVIDKCKEDSLGGQNNCIIFDDQGAYLKDPETRKLFKELVYNRRHYRCSIFFLNQSYLSLEKDLRKLFTNVFIFKVSKSEMEYIFDEILEQKKEYLLDILKTVYTKKFDFLFVNVDSQRMFKNWDEIKIY